MQNKILTQSTSFFKKIAKIQLKGKWIQAMIATVIFILILQVMDIIVAVFLKNTGVDLSGISNFYYLLVFGPASVGYYGFLVKIIRNEEASPVNCFEGFEKFGRSFVLGLLMLIFISLWSLLLVIPGIIAAYRYSMAPMLLRDRADLSPLDCIRESKRLMIGNKGKLFTLDISFIGWYLLFSIPVIIIVALLIAHSPDNIVDYSYAVSLIAVACTLWVTTYSRTATAAFYQELTRDFWQFDGEQFYGSGQWNAGAYSYQRYDENAENSHENYKNTDSGLEDSNERNN